MKTKMANCNNCEYEKECREKPPCILEAYQKGRADAMDELVSKVCTTWLFIGNSGKAYRDEIKFIAERLKEQMND